MREISNYRSEKILVSDIFFYQNNEQKVKIDLRPSLLRPPLINVSTCFIAKAYIMNILLLFNSFKHFHKYQCLKIYNTLHLLRTALGTTYPSTGTLSKYHEPRMSLARARFGA